MTKSLLNRITPENLLAIKDLVAYDPTSPNGLRWLVKRKGRNPSGVGQTFWIGYSHYQASWIVMILNGKWPTDGDSVVVRINKEGLWGDVNNLMWAPMGHQTVVGKIHKRHKHLQSVFGNSIPSLGDNFRLSTMCKRGHKWNDYPVTLYAKKGNEWRCEQCIRINKPLKRDPDAPRPTVQERRRTYKAAYRQALASRGLTAKGTKRINAYPGSEQSALNKALRTGGNLPSVARLVMQQQRQYWDENPRAKARHYSKWKRLSWWLRYAITPDLRLYHREKSKRRKAQDRGQTPMQVPVPALRQRFNEFNNCCAYCGTDGDMQIEHVVPISKNGAHDIGNIVPACMSCNFSKRSKDMEDWYKNQPFFNELRLKKIQSVLTPPCGVQLDLAIA